MPRTWGVTKVETSGQILLCHCSGMPCLSSEGTHGHSVGLERVSPLLGLSQSLKQHQATWSTGLLNTESVQFSSVSSVQFSQSVQSLSCVWLFVTPWTAAHQDSLSITDSWSLLRLTSTELVMPSNHHILCHLLLLLSSNFPASGSFPISSLHQVAKLLEFQLQHQSFQWIFRTDLL